MTAIDDKKPFRVSAFYREKLLQMAKTAVLNNPSLSRQQFISSLSVDDFPYSRKTVATYLGAVSFANTKTRKKRAVRSDMIYDQGYTTATLGKLFHQRLPTDFLRSHCENQN